MTISRSTCTANSWYWTTGGRTKLEESTWRIKIRSLSLEFSHVNTNIFVIFLVKIEIFDLHASIFGTDTCESDTTTPLFCNLWNTIHREIINIMTILMKTIKTRLNLYANKIRDRLGFCLFLEFTFVFFSNDTQSP